MNLEYIMWHNLGEFEEVPGHGKHGLVRVPRNIRDFLSERGKFIGQGSVGVEARFVTDAPNIDVYISCIKPEFAEKGSVQIFWGDFRQDVVAIEPGKVQRIRVNPPDLFGSATDMMLVGRGYNPKVVRLVFDSSTYVVHGLETHGHSIRKPESCELPELSWLAYGSSITNSGTGGYVEVAAKALDCQVQNMGFSGACHIEQELIDYIIDERTFDIITCELGINMLGWFSTEVFEQKAKYLIDRLAVLGKPSFIVTAFPSYHTETYTKLNGAEEEHDCEYRVILERLVIECKASNIHIIKGESILSDVRALSADLVHPTGYGHALMGFNLAKQMKELL